MRNRKPPAVSSADERFQKRRLNDLFLACGEGMGSRPMPRAVWDDVARGRFAHPGHRMLGALRAAVARAEATGDVALLAEKRAQVNEYFEAQRVSVLGASDIAPVATLPAAHIALVKEAGEAQLAMATAHASNFAAPYLEAAAREVADVEMTARRARASLLNALAMLGGRTAPMQAVR